MKYSAQEEYGLRLLIDIARAEPGQSITIPELAKIEELSEPHVAKLLMILRKAGFIKSVRGQSGGYLLAKSPDDIVIGDVLSELGGRLFDAGFCERHSGLSAKCPHLGDCALHDLWSDVQQAVDSVLYRRTLRHVLDRANGIIQLQTNGRSNGVYQEAPQPAELTHG
jgi:Rrf2 family protein